MSTFSQRMVGAAKLEVSIYKEIRADTQATGQALGVVALSSIALQHRPGHCCLRPGRNSRICPENRYLSSRVVGVGLGCVRGWNQDYP